MTYNIDYFNDINDEHVEIYYNNRLIIDFMGITLYKRPRWVSYILGKEEGELLYRGKDGNLYLMDELNYHESWDLLMEVVKKIQGLYETENTYGILIDITTTYVEITKLDNKGGSFEYTCDNKLEKDFKPFDIRPLYKGVVEFIEWYNDNKL